ncbi:DNA polymerase IV [Cellulomonas sp. zg-ZUI188]|uniref:DNA polymerase IV n=1 Tax=Cellulomonas fengjieae TaxID=2819978 RepID=A0ABS3SFZ9_9CELL|nr:DNA polymerase IV [Cellulomonas fengjieae]MBO3084678.1 DNA polymerase IV [Cellulomonas fengjieae]QVI66998.1 DNA polymerase IV [Cellulomonas fengjieae]
MFVRSTILHADLDAFYASVEQRDDPRLRNRPVAVGGGGVILAASYEAKRRGVTTPMGGRQARALCPGLVIVRPRFDAYVEASRAVFEIFHQTTPLVQGVSIDEAFLDVGGLHRIDVPPVDIAARLRARVRDTVGLPITVGVARTPFLAKVASRVAKPDGLLLVLPADEESFLHPLPVEMLWGVGAVTAAKLHAYGLQTAGDVAELPRSVLTSVLGPAGGRHLYAVVHGQTPAKVVVGGSRGSIGAQRALGHGPHAPEHVRAALLGLVDRVCRRMRKADRIARTVVLRLRFEDYTKATRSRSLPCATDSSEDISAAALGLLEAAGPLIRERGITLVGVALSGLGSDEFVQLALPLEHPDRTGLDQAVDAVAVRFGTQAMVRASLLRRGEGITVPLLPDA